MSWSLTRSLSRAINGLQQAITGIAESLDFTRRAPQDSRTNWVPPPRLQQPDWQAA
jgi:hypothetical protein